MKLWIDTEFNEYRGALISMALVAEDGREWYGVRYCDDPGWWVGEHVMPYLNRMPERDADLRNSLAIFLHQFDSVHVVSDWPGDIAHFCNFLEYRPGDRIGPDRMTFEVRRDLPDTATTSKIPHNALEDARALALGGEGATAMTTIEDLMSKVFDWAAKEGGFGQIVGGAKEIRAAIEQYAAERVAEARKPLTDEQVWADEGIMAANAAAGLPMPVLMLLKRAIERAHGIDYEQI